MNVTNFEFGFQSFLLLLKFYCIIKNHFTVGSRVANSESSLEDSSLESSHAVRSVLKKNVFCLLQTNSKCNVFEFFGGHKFEFYLDKMLQLKFLHLNFVIIIL